jgi:hypothetical protein
MATNIQVAVRVRPFLPFEAGAKSCIEVLPGEYDDRPSPQKLSQGKSVRIVSFLECYSSNASRERERERDAANNGFVYLSFIYYFRRVHIMHIETGIHLHLTDASVDSPHRLKFTILWCYHC